jgi:hypothetical protein
MNDTSSDIPRLPREYFENQKNIPPEMYEPYIGQHIAWNWQGDTILAGAATRKELAEKLRAKGYDLNRVVFSFVPGDDAVHW